MVIVCATCRGTRKAADGPCLACLGTGKLTRSSSGPPVWRAESMRTRRPLAAVREFLLLLVAWVCAMPAWLEMKRRVRCKRMQQDREDYDDMPHGGPFGYGD